VNRDEQFLLPLDAAPRFGREDFLVGPANEAAFAHIERWPRWLSPAAVITGPAGSGKSHLATVFAQESGARMIRADHLDKADVPHLAHSRALVLEDADRYPADEVALFHLLNLARETGQSVVLTARLPPDQWGIRTPDLLSRLRAQPLLVLAEPGDSLLAGLFVKHFADRQIHVDAQVVSYALARIERSYGAVQNLVAALDHQSLLRKKPVSRAMVAEILGSQPTGEEEADEA
jgi:chromosomal replication initiation ATPase DnaA